MNEVKFTNCQLLTTDNADVLNWVEKLPDGRLFSIMPIRKMDFDTTHPRSQYLFGRISEDMGKTWGKPYFMYEWEERIGAVPVLGFFSDSDGRVHVFATEIHDYYVESPENHIAYVRFDSYRGENPYFSDIPALHRYTGSLNNIIETENGRLVAPFSTRFGMKFVSSTIYSDDHGTTWNASNDIIITDPEEHVESGALEPVVAEVKPGVLVMVIRTVLDRLYYAVSYDCGETWGEAKQTNLPSSNAPPSVLKLPNGKFFLTWNNALGHPMGEIRYSYARQCLHGAISDDGLKTIRGARFLIKKIDGDPNGVQNPGPVSTAYSGDEILLRCLEIFGKGNATWKEPQANLALVPVQFLNNTDVQDNWEEWVGDYPKDEDHIILRPTVDGVAHTITNMPYSTRGSIKIAVEGKLPETCRILLSNCYLDVLNFQLNERAAGYEEIVGEPYRTLKPTDTGCWELNWDDKILTLSVNGQPVQTLEKASDEGYNHLTILFENEGELHIRSYSAHAEQPIWKTGIEY